MFDAFRIAYTKHCHHRLPVINCENFTRNSCVRASAGERMRAHFSHWRATGEHTHAESELGQLVEIECVPLQIRVFWRKNSIYAIAFRTFGMYQTFDMAHWTNLFLLKKKCASLPSSAWIGRSNYLNILATQWWTNTIRLYSPTRPRYRCCHGKQPFRFSPLKYAKKKPEIFCRSHEAKKGEKKYKIYKLVLGRVNVPCSAQTYNFRIKGAHIASILTIK